MTKKRSVAITAAALTFVLAAGAAGLLMPEKKGGSALTANDLLSGSSVTIQQNAALPAYMEKIWWNGQK